MNVVTEKPVKFGLVLEIMDIGGTVILLLQSETAIVGQTLAALGVAVAPETACDILVDVGAMPHKGRQVVTQVIETVIARLPRQFSHFTIDSLKVVYSNTYIHVSQFLNLELLQK